MTQFIVKEKQFEGTYRNPYRRGGRGLKWGSWKTRSKHDTLEAALAAAVVRVGMAVRSVFYRGKRLSDGNRLLTGVSIEKELERLAQQEKGAAT